MIDYETLSETGDGDRFDRLTALLIGIVAIVAAVLVVVQTSASLAEARHNAVARRLTAELTTRIIATRTLANYRGVNSQRAALVNMEGISRNLHALEAGDAAEGEVATATSDVWTRLAGIALEMGGRPDADSPLDPWARDILAEDDSVMLDVLAVQNRAADDAEIASTRSSRAVMGLSMVALAGVLVGLAAVVGAGRAGRALLGLAWLAAGGAVALLVISSGVVAL